MASNYKVYYWNLYKFELVTLDLGWTFTRLADFSVETRHLSVFGE